MSIRQLFTPKPQEKVVFSLRRHPLTFIPAVFTFLVLESFPALAQRIFFDGQPLQLEHPLLQTGLQLLLSMYHLGVWLFFFGQFADYYLDVHIVTDDRILDINQKGLFGRVIAELDLSRIQDVHSDIKGIIPTLFSYGTVEVQTAGGEQNFVFEQVPNPHAVRQRILELAALDRRREAADVLPPKQAEMKKQGL